MTDTDLHVTFAQEKALLAALETVYSGPYECTHCHNQITAETGWKPWLAFFFRDKGAWKAGIQFVCGDCMKLADLEAGEISLYCKACQ